MDDKIEILKNPKLIKFLSNRLLYSWIGFYIWCVIIFWIVYALNWFMNINTLKYKLLFLSAIIVLYLLVFVYLNYLHYSKNSLDKQKKPKKFGIVIAIDDKDYFEWYNLKQDFIEELKWQLDNNVFKIIVLSNRLSKKINPKDKQLTYQINKNKRIKWHYWIYGKVEKVKDWKLKCFITTDACIFHAHIPDNVKTELSMDFTNIYPKDISFEDDRYKSWISFSWEYSAIVAKYIVWVACLISGVPLAAWNIHKHLHIQLNNVQKKDNVDALFDEKYVKLLAEKIKIIQYFELRLICNFFYQKKEIEKRKSWLWEWENLSKIYGLEDADLLNQKWIYEFLINKNIPLSKSFIKKSAKLWNKWYIYSLVFLRLRDRDYKVIKNNMKRIFKSDFTNEVIAVASTISFIDDILKEYPDRIDFLYWQALLYFYKLENFPVALWKIEKYINELWNQKMEYEIEDPRQVKIKIERKMKLKQF